MRNQALLEPLDLGELKSGESVVDLHEHHLLLGENVLRFLLKGINFPRGTEFFQKTLVLPDVVGHAHVISTRGMSHPRICYAQRYGQHHHSRFVMDVFPPSLNTVVIQLRRIKKMSDGECYLDGVFIAKELHPDCLDPAAGTDAYRFWQNHAFVFCEVPVDLTTVTSKPHYLPF